MSFRPVYVPISNRKRTRTAEQQRRNHHPSRQMESNYKNHDDEHDNAVPACIDPTEVLSKVQRPEDFMDEQDHNEWGGPTKVKAEFEQERTKRIRIAKDDDGNEHISANMTRTQNNNTPLDLTVRSLNIGERLLRKLGWRDSNNSNEETQVQSFLTAYLPSDPTNNIDESDNNNNFKVGSRILRKIVLQQSRVSIPPPWKGRWGLGYQSELAKTTSSNNKSSHQYRLSNVVNASGMIGPGNHTSTADGNYEATTLEDFVGTHSTAGFALREDEDDAYDDSMTNEKSFHSTVLGIGAMSSQKPKLVVEHASSSLLMEAYEHQDSDNDDDGKANPKNKAAGDFEGALSSWVMSGHGPSSRPSSSMIEGFVLGANNISTKPKLYRGPDVPKDWRIQPHVFGPNEHPSILKAIAHATKLAVAQERHAKIMSETLQAATLAPRPRSIFAGIGEQMKNRFAAASSSTTNDELSPHPEGIHDATLLSSQPTSTEPLITRTITTFAPEPLLCKRLNVTAPVLKLGALSTPALAPRRDEVFFQTQVLGAVAEETKKRAAETSTAVAILLNNSNHDDNDNNENSSEEPQRPALHVYKSIFDPEVAEDAQQDDDVDDDEAKLKSRESNTIISAKDNMSNNKIVPYKQQGASNNPPSPTIPPSEATLVPYDSRKSDHSTESSVTSTQLRSKQRRKRKHEKSSKKKSKKHRKRSRKSSRRYGDS